MPTAVTAWTVPDAKTCRLFDLNTPQPQPALSFTVMGHRGSRCHTTPDAPHICPALHANTSPAARPTSILQQLQCKCCNNAPAPTGPLRPKSGLVVLHPQLLCHVVLLVHVQSVLDCLDCLLSTQDLIHTHVLVLILLVVLKEPPNFVQPVWWQL